MATPRDAHDDATATLVREPRKEPLAVVLRAFGDEGPIATFPLRSGVCVVGSAPSSDLAIARPTVSRVHVELALVPEGVRVTDMKSHNGTFYLGHRIERMVLGPGTCIQVGGVSIAIDADAASLGDDLRFDQPEYRGMVGASSAMRRVFALLSRLEGSLVNVLIEGESGVGKELVARALHEGSSLAEGASVTVNCGAIPGELVASELFGHRRGAFTGAIESRKGAFESADGGTLFLDEIGELPLDIQPMLLRALESGEVRPVGEDAVRRVRVRVIAATNRDLAKEIAAGRFREDLFYRLSVVRIRVPPLRERADDIAPLARHFAESIGLPALPDEIQTRLRGRLWPGNARELRNAVQAYGALGVLPDEGVPKSAVLSHALGMHVDLARPYVDQKDEVTDRFTRAYLETLLREARGNQTVAARLARLDRGYLRRLLAKHGMLKG